MQIAFIVVGAFFMLFGAGAFIYFRYRPAEDQDVEIPGIGVKFGVSRPSLVIFLIGAVIFMAPVTPLWDDDGGGGSGSGPTAAVRERVIEGVATFRENQRHTGLTSEEGPLNKPKLEWLLESGGQNTSTPALVGPVLFVAGGDALYALNPATKEQLWPAPYSTTGLTFSSPALAAGIVYVGSLDGHLYAVDALTGVERWKSPIGEEVRSSPLVVGRVVYIGSQDGSVYAINAETGIVEWQVEPGGAEGDAFESSPASAEGHIYVGSWDKHLYALKAGTGETFWSFPTGGAISSSPAKPCSSAAPMETCMPSIS